MYGTLGLRNITLGVQKDKPNVTYCIKHILGTQYMGNEYLLNSKIELGYVSGWQLAPLKEKGVMNRLVHDE